MSDIKSSRPLEGELDVVAVERSIAELRAGRPVILRANRNRALVLGIEALDEVRAASLGTFASRTPRLVLPAPRLRRLGLERRAGGSFALPQIDIARVGALALERSARFDAPVAALSPLDEAALDLMHLALLLPAAIVVPASARSLEALALAGVGADAIASYRARRLASLHIVSRANVPLESALETEFIVFRGGEGLRDHVAIIVGQPDTNAPVTVRLHSACLTGDLFGSLKCDCGDQLRHTVKYMAENGGGILLYLDQEGRGNGLSNKIRAYRLQAQGLDTYDADEVLGFEHDQRYFDFAAEMLRQLGVNEVRVMTNNPAKISALELAGLRVAADQRIQGRTTAQNLRYLASKRDREGHYIDVDDNPTKGSSAE